MSPNKPSLEKPAPKKKRKGFKDYFDYRNNQVNQIGLILFSAFVIATTLHFYLDNHFTSEQWKTRPMTRHLIVDDLIKSQDLEKKHKSYVIKILGQPEWVLTAEKDIMLYELGLAPNRSTNQVEHLYIEFLDDTVVDVTITMYVPK